MRIHTSRRKSVPAPQASSDPLDAVGAIQPTDLVPHSTGMEEPEPVGIRVPAADVQRDAQPSMEEYVKRIEASAARLRAESGDQAAAGVPRRPGVSTAESPERRRRRALRRKQRELEDKRSGAWYRRRRSWVIIGLIIPLLFVIGASVYVLNIIRLSVDAYGEIHQERVDRTRWTVNPAGTPVPIPTSQVGAALPDWTNDEPFNVLLLGVDIREGDDDPPRSDTAIVVHIDPGTEEVAMMSVPRDLMVFIPGFGEDKFNAAYPIGEANAEEIPGGGPTLVAQTVEANFSIPIHYFATIDFDGFRRVVDRVGGVVVDVDYMLSDNQYPTDDLRLTRIYFPTGLQKLDGEAALQYVRTRHADSDFGRADRQQQVLMAIREQAISRDLITQAQSLIGDMRETVKTDLNFNEMIALANLGRQIEADEIARLSLWDEGLLFEHLSESEFDPYYLEADWDAVLAETQAFFGEQPAAPEDTADENSDEFPDFSISVFVENATDIPLLAGSSAQLLVDAGYAEVWPSDARSSQTETTIQAAPGGIPTARHIAGLLGVPESTIQTVNGSNGITVTLGSDVPDSLIPDPDDDTVAG